MKIVLFVMLLGVLSNAFGMDGDGRFKPDLPPRQRPAGWIHGLRDSTLPRLGLLERMYPKDVKGKGAPKKLTRKANPTRPKQELQREIVVVNVVVSDAKEVAAQPVVTPQTPDVVDLTATVGQLTLSDEKPNNEVTAQPVVIPQASDAVSLTANVAQLTVCDETPNHQEVVESQEDVKKPEQEEPVEKVSLQVLIDSIQAACDEKNAQVQKPDEKVLGIIASHFDGDVAHSQFWNTLKEAMRKAINSSIVISLEDFGKALAWWFQHKGKHIDQITDKDKRTLLHEQVLRNLLRNKKKDLCGFFLAAGASIACRDNAKRSPLMAAVDEREKEIYILFFERFPRNAYEELKELTRRRERDQRERQSPLLGFEWYEAAWRCYYNTVVAQHLNGVDFTCEQFLKQVKKEIAKDTEYGI